MRKIEILDTTLRDGMQAEGIAYSPVDKGRILQELDSLGVALIEAGNPAASPQELAFV